MNDEMSQNPGDARHDAEQESLARPKPFVSDAEVYPLGHGARQVQLSFGPKSGRPTPDEALWDEIRDRSSALAFAEYATFIDSVLSDPIPASTGFESGLEVAREADARHSDALRNDTVRKLKAGLRTNLFGPDAYLLLKLATEQFLIHTACDPSPEFLASGYLQSLGPNGKTLPYLKLIRERLRSVPVGRAGRLSLGADDAGYALSASRLFSPCFVEPIWSYWHEQGMLVQTINLICLRFQNIRYGEGRDPLANFALDPLRPLSNLLWGYLQDEPQRLSRIRREHHYYESYNLMLGGRSRRDLRAAEGRSKFLPAFHELLYQAHLFFRDDDIATVQADAFPMLNALRELHFVLAEGMHNQFGDLPSQARIEMLIQQYLLARPEIREFLRGRVMVPYPEPWMDCVDTMKTLQGWSDVPVMYFNELGVTAEQLLLSVRFADWSTQSSSSTDSAANWARRFRSVIQRYTYAYRMATNIDLAVDRVEVQSAALRSGQPPIRMRGGSGVATAIARPLDEEDAFDQLPPANQRALPNVTGATGISRSVDRARRRL